MFPVSVVIVTNNEELNIEDALKSVADAKEIIVIDSFSADRTVEICRKYTDRVYQHEWQGFAGQKQMAVDYAEGPWVLILDADERVTPELKAEITENIADTDCSGFYMPRENYFIGKRIRHSGWWPDNTLRLFRKDKGYLEPREVHEKVIVQGNTGYLKNPLKHFTYRSVPDFTERMERYSTLAAREIRKNSGRAGLFSLTIKPVATFVKMYMLRLGLLDGTRGLMLAVLYSYYTFLKYAKTWEKQT
ncbi:MAG TPA: glycosyltransferase family 2 protein [Nitrospirae bacterium]|nr:glycosyltransferase family 2 protein [Nitrospirota bacterium]